MKYIKKKPAPKKLVEWANASALDVDGNPTQWGYDTMKPDLRDSVKQALIREQGGLCCYSGQRITMETSHIEHLKPQKLCTNHEDTDYRNLLAAYPSKNSPIGCKYGAHQKSAWFPSDMVHPLHKDCEQRLTFRGTGRVQAAKASDKGAIATIEKLKLNYQSLVDMRRSAIHVAIFEIELTVSELKQLIAGLDCLDSNGNYQPFCFAIKQVAQKQLERKIKR